MTLTLVVGGGCLTEALFVAGEAGDAVEAGCV